MVYSKCKGSLVAGKVPATSIMYGNCCLLQPEHLPTLKPVERLIAAQLPFMSIRHLMHGNEQYRIKGRVFDVHQESMHRPCLSQLHDISHRRTIDSTFYEPQSNSNEGKSKENSTEYLSYDQ